MVESQILGRDVSFRFLSAALSLALSVRSVSVSHGLGGRWRAGFVAGGQSLSNEAESADSRVVVAASGGRAEKAAQGGRLERMSEERVVGDSVRRFRLYEMLWSGVGGLQLRTRGREKEMR